MKSASCRRTGHPTRAPRMLAAQSTAAWRSSLPAPAGRRNLAGILAAHTTLPIIGVPVANGPLNGFDALLATVQMPPGIPVATVGHQRFRQRRVAGGADHGRRRQEPARETRGLSREDEDEGSCNGRKSPSRSVN